jgi:hypothetical protein
MMGGPKKKVRIQDVDYRWHTFLHEILIRHEETGGKRIVYLMAFLDDTSRFILHHRLIFNKMAGTCAGAQM